MGIKPGRKYFSSNIAMIVPLLNLKICTKIYIWQGVCAQLHDASGRHRAGQVWRPGGWSVRARYCTTLRLPHSRTTSLSHTVYCLSWGLGNIFLHCLMVQNTLRYLRLYFFKGVYLSFCWHRFLTGFINVLVDKLDIFLLLRQPACFCYHLSAAMVTKCPRDATKCHIGASTLQVIMWHLSLLYNGSTKTHFQVS